MSKDGNSSGVDRLAWAITIFALLAGCTPDLHEWVGPLVPEPNVTGYVLRDGAPAAYVEIELEVTDTDSTVADTRTDAEGHYSFSEVGAGRWTVRTDSNDTTDFAKVSFDFTFAGPDTTIEVPALEISLAGLRMIQPEEEAELPVPSFSAPMYFEWERSDDPDATVRVQFFTSNGEAFWYSGRTLETTVRWNGFGNRGDFGGERIGPGSHQWRLRVERPDSQIEWTTAYRLIEFTEAKR
jgi:hypothetical protein